jgi:hypothetical protein
MRGVRRGVGKNPHASRRACRRKQVRRDDHGSYGHSQYHGNQHIHCCPPQLQPNSQRSAPQEVPQAVKSSQQDLSISHKIRIICSLRSVQHVDPGNQPSRGRVPSHDYQQHRSQCTIVLSNQSSTRVSIGSAGGLPSSQHHSYARSAITATGLLPYPHPLIRLICVHPSLSSYA